PVPRLSNRINRENEASSRKKSAAGPSHACSSADSTQPFTNTTSKGPSPTVAYAMLMSPLFAKRTSGASMAVVSAIKRLSAMSHRAARLAFLQLRPLECVCRRRSGKHALELRPICRLAVRGQDELDWQVEQGAEPSNDVVARHVLSTTELDVQPVAE